MTDRSGRAGRSMTGFWKVFGAAALVVAVAVVIVGAPGAAHAERDGGQPPAAARRGADRVPGRRRCCPPCARATRPASIRRCARWPAACTASRLTVLDAAGNVLADSDGRRARDGEPRRPASEVRDARSPGAEPIGAPARRCTRTCSTSRCPCSTASACWATRAWRCTSPTCATSAPPSCARRAVGRGPRPAGGRGGRRARRPQRATAAAAHDRLRRRRRARRARRCACPRAARASSSAWPRPSTAWPTSSASASSASSATSPRSARSSARMVEGVLAIDADAARPAAERRRRRDRWAPSRGGARGKPLWEVTRLPEMTELLAALPAHRAARRGSSARARGRRPRPRPAPRGLAAHRRARRSAAACSCCTTSPRCAASRPCAATSWSTSATSSRRRSPPCAASSTPCWTTRPWTRRARNFLGRARDNTDRLVAIVTDLLTLARVEAEDDRRDTMGWTCATSRRSARPPPPTPPRCAARRCSSTSPASPSRLPVTARHSSPPSSTCSTTPSSTARRAARCACACAARATRRWWRSRTHGPGIAAHETRAHLRALLPRGQEPRARAGGHRPGALDRPQRGPGARRAGLARLRSGPRKHLSNTTSRSRRHNIATYC